MIIRFPTGLYRNVIPHNPADGGNVTYTISNTDPPRSDLLFPKIPDGISDRKHQQLALDPVERRDTVGDLVYSVSSASRSQAGDNAKQYTIGQLLEFQSTPVQSVAPLPVPQTTEIRYDTNLIDYATLGITPAEQQSVGDAGYRTQLQLITELNELKQQRADLDVAIAANQRLINEATRASEALQVIAATTADTGGSIAETLAKLQTTITDATATRATLLAQAGDLNSKATTISNQLQALAAVLT